MASLLSCSRATLQFPRYVPTLIARAQASQNNPSTPGEGVPMSGSTKTVSQSGGTKKGDSSVLPKSTTSSDQTNPTKTSSDGEALGHDDTGSNNKKTEKTARAASTSTSKSSSSSSDSNKQQSFLSTPIGQLGTIAVVAASIYAGYTMMNGGKKDVKQNEHYKRATADYQAANAQGTDVKK